MLEPIPDLHIFMMCPALNRAALAALPEGYTLRSMRPDEYATWKAFPFDNPEEAEAYGAFMDDYFQVTYRDRAERFFRDTQFVCDPEGVPVATCLIWKAYDAFYTVHWLKVAKTHEGMGLGRALLSHLMLQLEPAQFPVYLHTQPGSYRAIKLYSDFGFCLLSDPQFGTRRNELAEAMPFLAQSMPAKDFAALKVVKAPAGFVELLEQFDTLQF